MTAERDDVLCFLQTSLRNETRFKLPRNSLYHKCMFGESEMNIHKPQPTTVNVALCKSKFVDLYGRVTLGLVGANFSQDPLIPLGRR